MPTETVEVRGHIIESLLLPKILDTILEAGCDYQVEDFRIGRTSRDPSVAVIRIDAPDEPVLRRLVENLHVHGANLLHAGDALVEPAPADGVLPAGFYATTNLPTEVRLTGRWVPVESPEMDCAIVVEEGSARTVPMHRVRKGDPVVVGNRGVRVQVPRQRASGSVFAFMDSDVSPEKPKGHQVAYVADRMARARAAGAGILVVAGPAVVHTGGAPALERMVEGGWVDVLFTGNGFATHDIEAAVFGTSLGVSIAKGEPVDAGHSNHLRVINEIRRHGSIEAAVRAGYVTRGVMAACVRGGVPFVIAGSIRDDGPLPDTITDVVTAADVMRRHVRCIGVALVLASTLHGIATGNLLPATVETFCVDMSPAVATKLADRGSHQALGIVTDVAPFLDDLVSLLDARRASPGSR
ncbi:MAG: TIGR00300 family protein [Acidimicrobiales bacterium]|nr:MAG: TIGR00300 family protein [Acidimicrobiales bacterium]